MRNYASLPEKPEWLTMEDIDRYDQRMEPPYEVVVYHHFENGFDERLDYQTLAEAEQAAQKYVAGTMEGEDGFAYRRRAAVYDLHEHKWLRVFGDFPDERAIEQADLQPKKEEPAPLPRNAPTGSASLLHPCTRKSHGMMESCASCVIWGQRYWRCPAIRPIILLMILKLLCRSR